MFNFNLKPGHTTSADGLLESVGAFELTGQLLPGHVNAADGFLVAAQFYQVVVAAGAPANTTGTADLTETASTLAATGTIPVLYRDEFAGIRWQRLVPTHLGKAALTETPSTLRAAGRVTPLRIVGQLQIPIAVTPQMVAFGQMNTDELDVMLALAALEL